MTALAHGTDQVAALERLLWGEPPAPEVIEKAMAEAVGRGRARAEECTRQRWADARRSRPRIEAALAGRISEEAAQQGRMEVSRELQRRAARALEMPALKPVPALDGPEMTSSFTLKTVPYDAANASAQATADPATGGFSLAAQSIGDDAQHVWAYLGSWFTATEDNAQQRVAADIVYNFDWWDSAEGYVAHNDFTTSLQVAQLFPPLTLLNAAVPPTWQDGVGWYESHGNNGLDLTSSPQAFFPAVAGQRYLVVVGLDALVNSDGGFLGIGASTIHFDGVLRDVVFGG
jgi:hypothetical protein